MALERILDSLPEYAKDLRLNVSSLLRETSVSSQQLWGTMVACALAARNAALADAVLEDAEAQLSPQALAAAKGATAIMSMNNVYYRFTHLSSHERYRTLPAKLRMNFLRLHGVEEVDFELWCLAVSAINACGMCIDSHERKLREGGVTEETIATAVRVGAVITAIATLLDTAPELRSLS